MAETLSMSDRMLEVTAKSSASTLLLCPRGIYTSAGLQRLVLVHLPGGDPEVDPLSLSRGANLPTALRQKRGSE